MKFVLEKDKENMGQLCDAGQTFQQCLLHEDLLLYHNKFEPLS
jgi:hypothetical protein